MTGSDPGSDTLGDVLDCGQVLHFAVLSQGVQCPESPKSCKDHCSRHIFVVSDGYFIVIPSLQTFRFQLGPNYTQWCLWQQSVIVHYDRRLQHHH